MKLASLRTTWPSARRFAEIVIAGSSKVTREALSRIPAERMSAFIDDVAGRLRDYEIGGRLELPMETGLVLAGKPESG